MKLNRAIRNVLLLQISIVAGCMLLFTGCDSTKKGSNSDEKSNQSTSDAVSMKPTATDEDPAYVYFTADSSGYYYTYRIKSNGTGLEKLYESKAGPIWISPDNKKVYISDQIRLYHDAKDPFCPKGITIWDIEKKEKTVLPFYNNATVGDGWYDKDNILYSTNFISSKMVDVGGIGYNSIIGLFKQNIHPGDTTIVLYWEKRFKRHCAYNPKDSSYYYIDDDSLLVFKAKNKKHVTYPIQYHSVEGNNGFPMLTNAGTALFIHCFDANKGHFYIMTDLQGKTLLTVDNSIDTGSVVNNIKIDKNGKWIYFEGYKDIGGTAYSFIKRKSITAKDRTEIIFIKKIDDMSIGYIALGYEK